MSTKYYEEVDNHGVFHRIEKRIAPEIDGTKLVKEFPVLFDLEELPNKLSVDEFDKLINNSIPDDTKRKIAEVIESANQLAKEGKADQVSIDHQSQWRRGMYLSWLHSRDMTTIMTALGYPKDLQDKHDLGETCKAKYLKQRISNSDPWYIDLVMSFDDEQDIVIGFYNPHFSGSLYNWGLHKLGKQNAMDAHRLSDHHLGNPDKPLDLIEKAVNFVNHHLPREHYGIRHEPRGDWENLEEIMIVDHSTRNNPLLRLIARDAAKLMQMLELEGKIVPWQLLDPGVIHAQPKNVDLKLERSQVLRESSIHGTAIYDVDKNVWTISGSSGWNIMESTDGDPLSVRISFSEPLDPEYTLTISPRSYGDSRLVSYEVIYSDESGFRVLLDCDQDYLTSLVGFDFSIKGIKAEVVPDDRTIPKKKLIEDHHAVENILAHEAEFGVVTVMCSASIKSRLELEDEIIRRTNEKKSLIDNLNSTRINSEITKLKNAIAKVEARLVRLDRMIISSKYWDSAKNFGELWGDYCSKEQKDLLGGRHVPICTGGGPGIMAAAARGAQSKNAQVLGIDSIFGNDNRFNLDGDFSIYSNVRLRCNDFAIREAALINYSHVVLFWPGGYGTSWEVFETLCKIQTDHLRRTRTKAFFVHSEFWMPLYDYIKHLVSVGTVNEFNDRIKIPGIDDDKDDDYYVAEFVSDELEAYRKTRAHIEWLYKTNNLSLS